MEDKKLSGLTEKQRLDNAPKCFAIVQGKLTCSVEGAHLGTLRVCYAGTRKIVTFSTMAIINHLKKTNTSAVHVSHAYEWVKTATSAAMTTFLNELSESDVKPMHASIGNGDAVYLPAGFTFIEKGGQSQDVTGIRIVVVRDCDLTILSQVHRHFISVEKPNEALAAMVDSLSLVTS